MSEELIRAVREEIEAFNAGDWDRLAAAVSEDVVHEELATGQRVEGRDAFVKFVRAWKEVYPDAKGTVTDAFACGDRATFRITWEGTQSGALELPGSGEILPTHRRMTMHGCQVYRMADGKIAESVHYFDMLGVLEQLGTIKAEELAHAGA
jgi:steroid delta-isomerase-like uncharacterized protein